MAYLVGNNNNNNKEIYTWNGLHWEIDFNSFSEQEYATARCPKQRCNFEIILDKSIEEKEKDFLDVLESLNYKDAEIINIDGELISVQKEEQKDKDYWIEAKLSKNKKGQVQLMVLAGSKKQKDKTQLFLDPSNEKLTFDQNNDHPKKFFAKVIAVFKDSKSEIVEK